MSESEIASISKPFVPSNTKKNTSWAVTVFQKWRSYWNATASEGERQCQGDLLEKAHVEELNYSLSRFVGEVCYKSGEPYSPYLFAILIAFLIHFLLHCAWAGSNNPLPYIFSLN